MSSIRVLIVRLGSLGDIVHAIPVAAALREAYPTGVLNWLVEPEGLALLNLLPILDRRIVVESGRRWRSRPIDVWRGVAEVVNQLRGDDYDVALDLQGLWKSAALARSSGASRVIGFRGDSLREPGAAWLYTEHGESARGMHVIDKNLMLLERLGIRTREKRFPLAVPERTAVVDTCRGLLKDFERGFIIINGGAGWPNKRWPPDRYGEVARWLQEHTGYQSLVVWGPGEELLAGSIEAFSEGAAVRAPATGIADLLILFKHAALLLSGDTGPLHLAAAVGTPIVGLYGPTDPKRNGPWSRADVTVSRFPECECHYRRFCRRRQDCLRDISVDDVTSAVERRLSQNAKCVEP